MVNNNSGFMFSMYKYDEQKRFSIVLTLKSAEEIISKSITIDEIMYKLNTYYEEKCCDVCPYHFILTQDGICHSIKDSMLTVPNEGCEFEEYKNDIKILVMADRLCDLNKAQTEAIIEVLAEESRKYALLLSDTLYFQKSDESYMSDISKYENIIKNAILKRNKKHSLFSILEHVIEDQIIINNKIRAIPPLESELGLADIAIMRNVPLSILENLNPHITDSNTEDIVFIPNVKTLECKNESIKIYKKIFLKTQKIKKILEEISNGI